MTEDERAHQIRSLLWDHVHPTLRSMDRERIAKLAEQVLRIAAAHRELWAKWGADRNEIAERAANLWVPLDDLRDALNGLPGPALTKVDVEQRIREVREKQYGSYPKTEMEAEALAAFAEEKARGTESPLIATRSALASCSAPSTTILGYERRFGAKEYAPLPT